MKTYKIPVFWSVSALVEVEAQSLDDAIFKVDSPHFPLPEDSAYLESSFGVDTEMAMDLNDES